MASSPEGPSEVVVASVGVLEPTADTQDRSTEAIPRDVLLAALQASVRLQEIRDPTGAVVFCNQPQAPSRFAAGPVRRVPLP